MSVGAGSRLSLHTVNATRIATTRCDHLILSLAFSNAPEGRSINAIAAGLSSGTIRWAATRLDGNNTEITQKYLKDNTKITQK